MCPDLGQTREIHVKKTPVAATALALTLLATACGGSGGSDGETTLRFAIWGSEERYEVVQAAVQAFMDDNPGIQVETTIAEYDPYWQRMNTEMAGGNAPDVFLMSDRHLREYAGRNVVMDLAPHVGEGVRTDDIIPQVMGLGTDGDHLWGLPMSQITITMPYNPQLWEDAGAEAPELGWTWDDYLEAAQLVSEHTDEEVYGASDFGGIESWFKVYLSQQGKSLYTEDGELGYTADDVAEWWEMATEFREAGATTPAEVTNDTTAGSPMFQRHSASEFTPDSTFGPDHGEQFDGDFALAPLPQGDSLGLYAEPAMLISASARTSHEEESLALIDYVVNEPAAAEALGMAFGLPANQTNREHISADLEGAWQQVYEYEELVGPELKEGPPAPPQGASALFDLFTAYYEDVMFDRADPEEQARAFYAEAEQVIADNQD